MAYQFKLLPRWWLESSESSSALVINFCPSSDSVRMHVAPNSVHHNRKRQNYQTWCFLPESYNESRLIHKRTKSDMKYVKGKIVQLMGLNLAPAYCGFVLAITHTSVFCRRKGQSDYTGKVN